MATATVRQLDLFPDERRDCKHKHGFQRSVDPRTAFPEETALLVAEALRCDRCGGISAIRLGPHPSEGEARQ